MRRISHSSFDVERSMLHVERLSVYLSAIASAKVDELYFKTSCFFIPFMPDFSRF
jgi:hypothetical protein